MRAFQLAVAVLVVTNISFCAGAALSQTQPRDGYVGIVSKSDKRKVGEQFTFANLRAPRPFVTYPSGHGEETAKVFEDNEMIVLIFVAHGTGSTETYYLSKTRSRFTLIEVGAMQANVEGTEFQPVVTYGNLR